MKKPKIPQTDSIQGLAKFWDTHDATDYEDEMYDVTEPVFEPKTPISLHLETNAAQAVHQIAESKGVADTELIRQWVLERIRAT